MKNSLLIPFFCLVLLLKNSWAGPNFDEVQIQTIPVAKNIYMLKGQGGNIGVSVGEDGILIIDDQFAPLAEKIEVALQKLNKGELKFILNTHWHPDHTGSNEVFGKESTIIAHTNVRKRLATHQEIKIFKKVHKPSSKEALPVITFDHSLSIHFNNEEIQVLHFPEGHTDGDSVIFFPRSNVVHMGDHYFARMFPFVDLGSGGNVVNFAANIDKILKRLPNDVKIIPGHGPLSTKKDLKNYKKMLQTSIKTVTQAIQKKKSLDQIKAEGLPQWEKWNKGFLSTDQWLEIVYNSLTQ